MSICCLLPRAQTPFLLVLREKDGREEGHISKIYRRLPQSPFPAAYFARRFVDCAPKSGVPDRTDGTEPGRWDNSGNQSASLACRAENHNHNRRTGLSSRQGLADFPDFWCALTKIGVSWIPPHLPTSDSCRAGVAGAPSTNRKVVNHGPLYM